MERDSNWVAHTVGWLTAAIGGLTLDKWAMIIGIATSIGTFGINWYYKRLSYRRGQ